MLSELIYADMEAENLIKGRYPSAKIEDASDFIHNERFLVEIETDEDEFYPFVIKEGLALCCLGFQMMMRRKENIDDVKRWMRLAGIEMATPKESDG